MHGHGGEEQQQRRGQAHRADLGCAHMRTNRPKHPHDQTSGTKAPRWSEEEQETERDLDDARDAGEGVWEPPFGEPSHDPFIGMERCATDRNKGQSR